MYTCPCSGHEVFDSSPGSFEICPIGCSVRQRALSGSKANSRSEQPLQGSNEFGQGVVHDVPNRRVVHYRIAVDQQVAEGNDLTEARDLRGQACVELGQLPQGLTDDFELAFNGGVQQRIVCVLPSIPALDETLDCVRSAQCFHRKARGSRRIEQLALLLDLAQHKRVADSVRLHKVDPAPQQGFEITPCRVPFVEADAVAWLEGHQQVGVAVRLEVVPTRCRAEHLQPRDVVAATQGGKSFSGLSNAGVHGASVGKPAFIIRSRPYGRFRSADINPPPTCVPLRPR